MLTFSVAPDLAAIVRPGVLWLEGATVVEREPRMDAPLAEIAEFFRLKPEATSGGDAGFFRLKPEAASGGDKPQATRSGHKPEAASGADKPEATSSQAGNHEDTCGFRLQAEEVRTMYKQVGLDPTKRRPSSEALLRRVRKGEPLPRINSMVDVCNWCSLEFQLPYGLYDAAKIEGEVVLRLGREGESYPGIRKDDVHVGGRIALADRLGPFGNPTSDSARTMVTTATTSALLVVFAPAAIDPAMLRRVVDRTAARMAEFTGGRETGRAY
jgi:DNA/RNA-binding domain of Phe-tRNA-synthetase-like protein